MSLEFNLKRDEALKVAGGIHRSTLSEYISKGELIEGIHFIKTAKEYLYCRETLNHWRNCGRDRNHEEHINLIHQIAKTKSGTHRRSKAQAK